MGIKHIGIEHEFLVNQMVCHGIIQMKSGSSSQVFHRLFVFYPVFHMYSSHLEAYHGESLIAGKKNTNA